MIIWLTMKLTAWLFGIAFNDAIVTILSCFAFFEILTEVIPIFIVIVVLVVNQFDDMFRS